jgi:transposase
MKMKSYSIDLREKIVNAYERGGTSVRKVAVQFGVAKSYVQKLLQLKKTQGHLEPKKQGGTRRGKLDNYGRELSEMVKSYPDATRHQNTASILENNIKFGYVQVSCVVHYKNKD